MSTHNRPKIIAMREHIRQTIREDGEVTQNGFVALMQAVAATLMDTHDPTGARDLFIQQIKENMEKGEPAKPTGARFEVIDKATHDCCNHATVVDNTFPFTIDGNYSIEAQLCECRRKDHAVVIAAALNRSSLQ